MVLIFFLDFFGLFQNLESRWTPATSPWMRSSKNKLYFGIPSPKVSKIFPKNQKKIPFQGHHSKLEFLECCLKYADDPPGGGDFAPPPLGDPCILSQPRNSNFEWWPWKGIFFWFFGNIFETWGWGTTFRDLTMLFFWRPKITFWGGGPLPETLRCCFFDARFAGVHFYDADCLEMSALRNEDTKKWGLCTREAMVVMDKIGLPDWVNIITQSSFLSVFICKCAHF